MLLVTVGICCFNASDTIERSIRSAQAQDWPDIEILVADDGSTDGSQAIVKRLASEDARVRLIQRASNGGVAATRNTIIENARGEYIAFQDDDDESAPTRISSQISRLESAEHRGSQSKVICFTSRAVIRQGSDGGQLVRAMGVVREVSGADLAMNILCGDPVEGQGKIGAGTMLARRSTLLDVGLFDERFRRCEEADLLVRFGISGGMVVGVGEPLLVQHITSGEEKGPVANFMGMDRAIRKHSGFLRTRHAYLAARLQNYRDYLSKRNRALFSKVLLVPLLALRPARALSKMSVVSR